VRIVTATNDKTAAQLRRRATQRLRDQVSGAPAAESDADRTISELEIHRVELQVQNEELLQIRSDLEAGLARYTELFDFAPIGYLVLDDIGRIRALNFAAARLLRRTRDELVGQVLEEIIGVHPRLDEIRARLRGLPAGDRKAESCELEIVRADGERIDVRTTMTAIADDVPTVLLAIEDITEKKRAIELRAQQ
jgi:PAS domain S-box-containing protein